jgi:hypothetical protein
MKQLAAIEETLHPGGNYKNYRSLMEEYDQTKPYVPIISLFLKDLFFANDGNPTFLAGKTDATIKMINLPKFESIFQRVKTFCQNKKNLVSFKKTTQPYIAAEDYFKSIRALKEQALYKYSCLCEPKDGDDNLKLRQKWMNE